METLSLSRLNEFIRRAIAVNFLEPVWITAEVLSAKLNRGHFYLEIAEKEDEEIVAQSSAVVWKSNFITIQKYNAADILSIVKEGNEVRLQVIVDYNIRYGLKLIVQNIDSSFTLGKIAQHRLKIIQQLQSESIWQKNKQCDPPLVIQKIAVITSLSSAGKKDFEDELTNNKYQYQFDLHYIQASMQGENAETEIVTAFNSLEIDFDAVVIVRGGGAKLDLINFDSYAIAKSISNCPYPVFSGIGHQIDESIADLSAYMALKTPTAVANYIIEHNLNYESKFIELYDKLNQLTLRLLANENAVIDIALQRLIQNAKIKILNEDNKLLVQQNLLFSAVRNSLNLNERKLVDIEKNIYSADPHLALSRGFLLCQQNNKRIRLSKQLDPKVILETIFQDGMVTSIIQS